MSRSLDLHLSRIKTNSISTARSVATLSASCFHHCLLSGIVLALLLHTIQHARGQETAKHSTITAASNMLHPPFSSWSTDRKAIGIEVEIVNSAARQLGLQVTWQERPFPKLFDAIANREINIAVSTIGRTSEREKIVAFSKPYYETQIVCLVKPDSSFKTLTDLATSKIGADKTTTSYMAAVSKFSPDNIISAADSDSTWPNMIHDGVIDAFVVDASDQARLESNTGLRLRRLPERLAAESFCIAFEKGNAALEAAINKAIDEIEPSIELRIGGQPQFTSPTGRQITSLKSPPKKLVTDYLKAKQTFESDPTNVENAIWFARRAGYLQRMNESIEILTNAMKQHPTDARLYRHRGHRFISMRQLDNAVADLEKAAKLIDGQPDRTEPDGAPNKENIPLTTTHGNIWYHLGLAYYLKNDLENALRCFKQRVGLEQYDDNYVANGHWIYMICRRLNRDDEARQAVEKVRADMRIIENMSYHKMCLFYAGQINESDLGDSTNGTPASDVILYGLGNWYLYEQNTVDRAKKRYEKLFENGSPFSFAYIAAESDYVRLSK